MVSDMSVVMLIIFRFLTLLVLLQNQECCSGVAYHLRSFHLFSHGGFKPHLTCDLIPGVNLIIPVTTSLDPLHHTAAVVDGHPVHAFCLEGAGVSTIHPRFVKHHCFPLQVLSKSVKLVGLAGATITSHHFVRLRVQPPSFDALLPSSHLPRHHSLLSQLMLLRVLQHLKFAFLFIYFYC